MGKYRMDKLDKDSIATGAPRFWVPGPLSAGSRIDLPERAARHVGVRRLREGDAVVLFDGNRGEYAATLAKITRQGVSADIGSRHDVERESPLRLTLAQGISSGDRMDLTLQKATELGVTAIVPLACERSVVRLSPERAARRLEHWRQILISACEQCGRNRVPALAPVMDLEDWLASLGPTTDQRLLLDPLADAGMAEVRPQAASGVLLLVGPEGGFAAHELAATHRSGFQGARLGPRILRTETAPLAAIAILQALHGDLG
jgi:16S rRNA (uracil1498-N3)-methyltransferase